MKRYENPNNKILQRTIAEGKTLCVCSHNQLIPPNRERAICTYCGRTIINTSKARFRYIMFNLMRKES